MGAPEGFAMQVSKDGRVRISHHGRVVTTLAGAAATKLIARADGASDDALQMLLAKATGNFARHNKAGGRG